jgi:type IV pilus assembly protein PilQ
MRESMIGTFRGTTAIVWGAVVAMGIFACATATQTGKPAGSEMISDVRVERQGDATVLTLVGLDDPVFTAFQESEPDRITIDLSGVESDAMVEPVAVYDGLVEEITMSPFASGSGEPMTRVEISTVGAASFEITATEEGLNVRMEAAPGLAAAETVDEETSPSDEMLDPWAIEPTAADAGDDEPEQPIEEAPPAKKLISVAAREVGEGALIELGADGTIASAVSFTLENPDRLVIDLPDMVSEVQKSRIEVGSNLVERIRVGQHDEMVRVVVDAGSAQEPFEGRRVVPGPAGLWIALGSDSALDVALEEATSSAPPSAHAARALESAENGETAAIDAAGLAPAEEAEGSGPPTPAASPEGSTVTVYGVEFDAQEERDRVVVLGERPLDYLVYEPDPETFILSISNADIEPEAAVRIAPEPGGPVSLVTSFAQPDVDTSEVRVVVKRAENLKPEISRRGSLLVLDFPRTGALAARPPVLVTAPGETLPGGGSETPAQTASAPGTGAGDGEQLAALPPTGGEGDLALAPTGGGPDVALSPTGGQAAPASLEPPASIDILEEGGLVDGKEYSGRRISLDFKDVDISDVLRLIAEVSDLNVIAGDEVNGKVTIRLVDVPWDQALDIILLTKGLGFMRIGNVLRIAPNDVIAQEEEARLQERRAKERLEDLVVKLQPVNYADAKAVSAMVKHLLSDRGTVNVDSRTNTLILKDIPSVIDEATALVKAIDTQTPQVMIEAKVVEAKLQFSREFGSVWSIGVQPYTDAWDDGSGLRQDIGLHNFRFRPSQLPAPALGSTNGLAFGNPITAGPTALANIGAFLLDEKLNLDVQLQAAETNGDGKVISSPRVVTMDNSAAKIEQGVSIPFQTFENGDAQLEFVDAVLKLDVTPHITGNKAIIMKIKVTRNAPDDSVFTLTGSPAIAKNEVDTETLVKDGQTLVLGGIYTLNKSQRQSRVPYLHSIPILGGMFRNNEISDDRQELLIFVTPRIVQGEQAAS